MNQNLIATKLPLAQAIKNVYHILPADNLNSVCFSGLFNRKAIIRKTHSDYSDQDVQKIRAQKQLGHYSLHDYVCTFINPQNKMSYRYQKENRNFVIIEFTTSTLNDYNWFLSKGNAACKTTSFFYKDENAIEIGLIKGIKSKNRGNYDLKMSEILFFTEKILPRYISKIILHPDSPLEPYYSLINRGFDIVHDTEYNYYCSI